MAKKRKGIKRKGKGNKVGRLDYLSHKLMAKKINFGKGKGKVER